MAIWKLEDIKSMSLQELKDWISVLKNEIRARKYKEYSNEDLIVIAKSRRNVFYDEEAVYAFNILASRPNLDRQSILDLKEKSHSESVQALCVVVLAQLR